ncbi:MAG: flagellar hook-associated protein FlgL [Desulfatitalea sp.]|nr:flagellar hook-associated protein FlgL [Desulfatitalea sp.]
MRISNAMMAENIKGYLSKHTERLLKTHEQIASGKRINRASDDPIGLGLAMGYRKSISGIQQFNENIINAELHINNVEDILNTVTDLLKEAKDISRDPDLEMRPMFADQVATIREHVLQLANSKINGFYVFAGDLTDTPPFDAAGVYAGDAGTKDYIIGDGMQVHIGSDGSQIFQGASDVFDVLNDLETALDADDTAGIAAQMPLLEAALQQLNTTRAVNSGQYKRLEATMSFNERFLVNVQDLLSRTEDTDIAAAAIDLNTQSTAYQSTLATAAKIIQPTLMDFLS